MHIITHIEALRTWRNTVDSVALIPTMGDLHAGHIRLITEARKYTSHIVVSIFVNRLQFGQSEDFEQYPRTLVQDIEKLKEVGVSLVFAPDESTLYPHTIQQYYVIPPAIQHALCGAVRPEYFRGVATIVSKLFNIVQPQFAVFGKKDFQQLFIIKNMVDDLNFPITVLAVETERAADGLALSSRNTCLSVKERTEAPQLYQYLCAMQLAIQEGERNYIRLARETHIQLTQRGWQVDYIAIRSRHTLQAASPTDQQLIILVAACLGKTRLVDNMEFDI